MNRSWEGAATVIGVSSRGHGAVIGGVNDPSDARTACRPAARYGGQTLSVGHFKPMTPSANP
jgi:hypothetical protein